MALLSVRPLQPKVLGSSSRSSRQTAVCGLPAQTSFHRISSRLCRDSHVVVPHLSSHQSGLHTVSTRHSILCKAAESAGAGSNSEQNVTSAAQKNKEDLVKICALGMLFFCSTFNYTVLQNLKDAIVVTKVGAEALPFLEAYGVLPLSFAFLWLYNKLNHHLPEKWVYQVALAPFLAFYAVFAFVLFPMAAQLHPTHLLASLKASLPSGFIGLASVVVHWSYSLFFCLGEMWGAVAISMLFWGLADEVCSVREAETIYPLLGIVANIGLVMSGAWIKLVQGSATSLATVGLHPTQALILTVLAVAVVLMSIKTFVHSKYIGHGASGHSASSAPKKEKKKKSSKTIGESLSVLKKSPKAGNLAVLVVAYFITQKLFDISWKSQLRVLYPSAEACQTVLAEVSQWTGIVTICLMATSKYVFRYGGWAAAALATPLSILVSGAVFFASAIVMQGNAGSFLPPHVLGVLLAAGGAAGIVGRIASKSPKYALFDPSKEMVFITMASEEKKDAKGAVDLLGSCFGKSGASWIMQILVLGMGSLTAALPVIAAVHMTVGIAWVKSTMSLAALMKGATDHQVQHVQVSGDAGGSSSSSSSSGPTAPVQAAAVATAAVAVSEVVANSESEAANDHETREPLPSVDYDDASSDKTVHVSSNDHPHSNGNGNGAYNNIVASNAYANGNANGVHHAQAEDDSQMQNTQSAAMASSAA